MFTGLVEEVGHIRQISKSGMAMELTIQCEKVLEGTKLGDSIAVNGVCLTVTRQGSLYFTADVMPETMKRTNLKYLQPSSPVNLERAVAAGQRMGGHFVQGHVDGTGTIIERRPFENAVLFGFRTAPELTRYMIEKGSVAVNGISLTIVDVGSDFFTVSVIPHTLEHTQLQSAKPGDLVNIECDMIGKYLAKWANMPSSQPLGLEKLKQTGFV
ncbi:riboflavin synthase [Paenactinomyces guangxiensis]|uniref:Riboflavin synthase n=1 Tax=Paenactinomyces guangxiensis TaxID=1490290 RepID=A0A7W1WTD3_9BACL|nr:riboflavin synthase [Paenactinomyces guangxiensis]MBA4495682.1 riboflavin synthase [Paenactinomyces guangxiensis]MBH8592670.1 riboflavin synthase [Paenactinomyces guangxiensis]